MDLRRLWYVTRKYSRLQGLRLLPFSVLLILSTAWREGWIRLPGDESPRMAALWFVVGLGIAGAAGGRVVRWYRRVYGENEQKSGHSLAPQVAIALVCLPILVEIQQRWALPFSLPIATLAAVVAAYGAADYPLRRHYLAAALTLYAYVLLPALGVDAPIRHLLFPALMGLALAIAAIGDHRLIATTLERTPTDV